ncbi:unnamed protein product [Toxocara canis]|uniref:Reverse transcriptase domain-containing protein n=1 Tax=Toxocara canis TaxID=6265 RepID=A0A183UDA5_TOXCA|nr:unnamed protein product [Toxocara canis]
MVVKCPKRREPHIHILTPIDKPEIIDNDSVLVFFETATKFAHSFSTDAASAPLIRVIYATDLIVYNTDLIFIQTRVKIEKMEPIFDKCTKLGSSHYTARHMVGFEQGGVLTKRGSPNTRHWCAFRTL